MFKILILRLRQFKKEYYVYLSMFAVSILLTGIMGGAFDGQHKANVHLHYLENDPGQQKAVQKLLAADYYRYLVNESEAQRKKDLKSGDALMAVDLSPFSGVAGKDSHIDLSYAVAGYDVMQMKMMLSEMISDFQRVYRFEEHINASLGPFSKEEMERLRGAYETDLAHKKIYEIRINRVHNEYGYSNTMHTAIGYTVFFSMFIMIMGAGNLSRDRETKAWARLKISPLKEYQIIGGTLMFTFLTGMIQMTLYYVSGKYLFGVNWGNSNLGVLLIMASYVFSVSAMGLFLASLLKSYTQLSAFSSVFITGTSMLGGTMWPLEIVGNKTVRALAEFTPQKWAVSGLEAIAMYGKGFEAAIPSIQVLLFIGTLFFILAGISLFLQRGRAV